jgi:hypothetical protein
MRISKALRTRLLFTLFSIISSIILLALPVQPVFLRFIFPALLAIIVFFFWFYPLVKYGGSYIERLKRADEEASKQKHPESKIINLVKAHNAQYPFAFVALILCLIMIAYLAGNGAATNQRSFLVIPAAEGFPELVVLKVYNQKLVCATFNRTTREVNHVFTFRDLVPSSETPEMMRLEEIGPLWSKPSL